MQNISKKIWLIQKKAVPLHAFSEEKAKKCHEVVMHACGFSGDCLTRISLAK